MQMIMQRELNLSPAQCKLFIHLVKNRQMNLDQLSSFLGYTRVQSEILARSLVEMGMIIEISRGEFQSLHPRFAVTNRYRKKCEEANVAISRNRDVDNIALALELPYEDARTK
jgi:predicted transcriptional regulator